MNSVERFLLILGLLSVSAGAIGAALAQTRAVRRSLEQRAESVAALTRERGSKQTALRQETAIEVIDNSIRDIFAFGLPYRWGMQAGALALLPLACVSAALAWLLVRVLLHLSLAYSIIAAMAAFALIPRLYLTRQQSREEAEFIDYFPDAIDMLVRMVRAGLTIMNAIRSVGNEAPSPLNRVFTNLADQVDIGIILEDALMQMGDRIGLPDFRFFVVAVSLQHATGGNIAATLDILSDIIRKRRAIRLKARATTAEVRVSAYVLAALPFVVIGGLLLLSPAYLQPLVSDPRGNAIVGAAILLLILGFVSMRQMMRRATRF